MQYAQEKIYFESSSYFDSLLKDIEKAKKSVDIEAYIFKIDSLGKKILNQLENCAKHGVRVRVLVDGAGTDRWSGNYVKKLEKAGGETRIFHPFPWRLWQWSRSVVHLPVILKAIYLMLKINSRNHRKTCIIDDEIVYIGSFNIDARHLGKEHAGEGWHDAGVKLSNININDIKMAFESAWSHKPIQERIREIFKHINKNPIIRLNNTRHRRRILYKNLLKRIKLCERRIWITNAYFVPDNFLLKALKERARSNVDVKILLPKKSDVPFMPFASATFYEDLLKNGVKIYEYLPSVLHAKTLILDDWVSVGSSNLNHRSLLHDLEVDISIQKHESKRLIEKQFIKDIEASKEIDVNNAGKRSFMQRAIGRMFLNIKFLI